MEERTSDYGSDPNSYSFPFNSRSTSDRDSAGNPKYILEPFHSTV